MNNDHTFFSRSCHSPIPRCAAALLIALACSCLASGGEIDEAVRDGDSAKVKALVKDNPELVFSKDTNNWTPLHYAAWFGHKDVAELLLANKANVNAKNNYGWTPLHGAAVKGQEDVAALLLDEKAEVNATDKDSFTPLHFAVQAGHKDVVELLLANKAEVNTKGINGSTPLHDSVSKDHKDIVELLLAHGAEVNAKDSDGRTPLHLALKSYRDVAAVLLLGRTTPLQKAEIHNHIDMAKLLVANGAEVNAKENAADKVGPVIADVPRHVITLNGSW